MTGCARMYLLNSNIEHLHNTVTFNLLINTTNIMYSVDTTHNYIYTQNNYYAMSNYNGIVLYGLRILLGSSMVLSCPMSSIAVLDFEC